MITCPKFCRIGIILGCTLLMVSLAACNSLISVYPGYTGKQRASHATPVGHQYFFSSTNEARKYLNRIARFEVEGPEEIFFAKPIITIVEESANGVYKDSTLEAEVPFSVESSAIAGSYDYKITMYDDNDTVLLVIDGSVLVAANQVNSNRRNGLIVLGIGAVVLFFGLSFYKSNEELATIGGILIMAVGFALAVGGILWFFGIGANP